jgi:outer membrane receptor protein involved in Fe transport
LIGVPFTIVSDLESRVISQELYLRSTDTIPWRWTVGGMYRKATELDDQTNVLEGTGTLAVYSTFQSESYAIFGELTRLFLDDRLEVTVGLRHFHDDESEWGLAELAGSGGGAVTSIPARKNTPRVLLAWHVTPDIMTYASYSQGFRSGIPQPNGLSAKFPALEPDTLYNYEMGSKGALFNGGLAYDLSVYYMDWKDIQQSLTIPGLNGVPTSVLTNRGNASGEGADLSVTVTPIPHLKLTGQISANNLAMDANVISGGVVLFSKGDRPDFSPAVTAGLSGAYDFGLGSTGFRGRLSASASYTSKQSYHLLLTDGAASAFGNSTVLSRASFAIDSSKGWVATVFVDNANNYHGAPLVPPYGIPEIASRVRPLTAGLQLDFHLR